MSDPVILRPEGGYTRWEAPTITPSLLAKRFAETPSAEQVADVLEQARREGYASGKREGHATGLREGRKAAEQQLRDMGQRVDTLLRGMAEPLANIDAAVEKQLIELVLSVSRQLLYLELELKPEQVEGVVREAVAALPRAEEPVQIHLNPQDVALLRELLPQGESSSASWQLHEDAAVRRGGCQVRRGFAEVDALLETRLEQVFGQLREQFEGLEDDAGTPDGPGAPLS